MSCKTRSIARSGCSGRKWKVKRTCAGSWNLNISTQHQALYRPPGNLFCFQLQDGQGNISEAVKWPAGDRIIAIYTLFAQTQGRLQVPGDWFWKETLRLGSFTVIERFTEELGDTSAIFELFIFSGILILPVESSSPRGNWLLPQIWKRKVVSPKKPRQTRMRVHQYNAVGDVEIKSWAKYLILGFLECGLTFYEIYAGIQWNLSLSCS